MDGNSRLSRLLASPALPMLAAAMLRLPGVTRPLLGNFATKNAVYAMIARNWAEGRAPAVHPTLDVLAGGERSLHLLEVPLSAYLSGFLWRPFGGSLDLWGRAVSIAFLTAAVGLLFILVRRWHGRAAAFGAGLALALSPAAIVYGQSFMLEASLVFFTLAAMYAWTRWLDCDCGRGRLWLVAASASMALLLLTKIYMGILLLPMGWLLWRNIARAREERRSPTQEPPLCKEGTDKTSASPSLRKGGTKERPTLAWGTLALLIALLPAAIWYAHVWQITAPGSPLAERVFYSVRQSADAHGFPHPLLSSPDFYRGLIDNLAGFVLTPIGLALAIVGLMHHEWRRHALWLAAMALLVVVLPRKFHEMNYYYLAILPPLCILVGLGWHVVCQRLRPGPRWTAALLLVCLGLSLRYAARPAFVTPAEDASVLSAAAAVRELTEKNEPVATLHGTTIDLLYYCDRPGLALSSRRDLASQLEECRRRGAKLLAVAGWDKLDAAQQRGLQNLATAARGDDYRLFRIDPAVVAMMRAHAHCPQVRPSLPDDAELSIGVR
ncbi:MAG: glycosyltransferase family 39 protein [Planctomycetia bacterium]|nr:glycosyltransferase family 39 protein [Planctomycetia bacterium]